jgi:hypothetical protein
MAAVQGSVGNERGMAAAQDWRMFPQPGAATTANLPAVSEVMTMLGGRADELVPIEDVQRIADRMRDGSWSPTSPSSGR